MHNTKHLNKTLQLRMKTLHNDKTWRDSKFYVKLVVSRQ